jgi:hypothetical protein
MLRLLQTSLLDGTSASLVQTPSHGSRPFSLAQTKNRHFDQTKTVISTEAAHAFVSSRAEKSASLPKSLPGHNHAFAFAVTVPTRTQLAVD